MPIGMQPSAPRRVERLMINLDTMLPMVCGLGHVRPEGPYPFSGAGP